MTQFSKKKIISQKSGGNSASDSARITNFNKYINVNY